MSFLFPALQLRTIDKCSGQYCYIVGTKLRLSLAGTMCRGALDIPLTVLGAGQYLGFGLLPGRGGPAPGFLPLKTTSQAFSKEPWVGSSCPVKAESSSASEKWNVMRPKLLLHYSFGCTDSQRALLSHPQSLYRAAFI